MPTTFWPSFHLACEELSEPLRIVSHHILGKRQVFVRVAIDQEHIPGLEQSLAQRFCDGAPAAEPRLTEAPAELARVLEAAVASLAAKVYVEQTLALQDERR